MGALVSLQGDFTTLIVPRCVQERRLHDKILLLYLVLVAIYAIEISNFLFLVVLMLIGMSKNNEGVGV